MKKSRSVIIFLMTLMTGVHSFAGAGFICDNYGNYCMQPGGDCSRLVPPTFICGFKSPSNHTTPANQDENQTTEGISSSSTFGGACCSWGENIRGCWTGC